MPKSPALRRYNVRVLGLSAAYAVLLIGSSLLFARHLIAGPAAWIVAILPALPIIGVFVVIGRLLVEMEDEYMRARFVQQSLIATAFALSITTVWGFLEGFGLVDHAPGYYAAILWFAGLGIGSCVTAIADRRAAR